MVWAMDKVTVRYSTTTGVTNKVPVALSGRESLIARCWKTAKAEARMMDQNQWPMWGKVLEFDRQYGRDGNVREQIRGFCRKCDLYTGNVFHRLWAAFRVLVLERNDIYGGARRHVVWEIKKCYYKYVFGTVGLFIVNLLRRNVWFRA